MSDTEKLVALGVLAFLGYSAYSILQNQGAPDPATASTGTTSKEMKQWKNTKKKLDDLKNEIRDEFDEAGTKVVEGVRRTKVVDLNKVVGLMKEELDLLTEKTPEERALDEQMKKIRASAGKIIESLDVSGAVYGFPNSIERLKEQLWRRK